MTGGKTLTDGEVQTEDLKEFKERSAILEHDAGLPRPVEVVYLHRRDIGALRQAAAAGPACAR